jgi:hypothetical protein
VQTGCVYMSAPDFRQSDDGASSSRGKKNGKVRGDFVRERELNRWLSRLLPGKDDWLVGKAVAIAIRRRTKPGTRITMRQLCYLSGMHWRRVMAALYLMRSNGRLQFSKAGVDFDSSFLFEIPSASEEEASGRQKQSPRPNPVHPSACNGVKIRRLRPGRAMGVNKKNCPGAFDTRTKDRSSVGIIADGSDER